MEELRPLLQQRNDAYNKWLATKGQQISLDSRKLEARAKCDKEGY